MAKCKTCTLGAVGSSIVQIYSVQVSFSFSARNITEPEYDAYYYDTDYEQADKRPHDLVKLRLTNILTKPNRTVLGMTSSLLLFSLYKKPFKYTTGESKLASTQSIGVAL